MDDRELFGLAAKSAGIQYLVVDDGSPLLVGRGDLIFGIRQLPSERLWNPLSSDGDAIRLAIHLSIFDSVESFGRFYSWLKDARVVIDNENAAFRRAVTCYAAEIGKAMP